MNRSWASLVALVAVFVSTMGFGSNSAVGARLAHGPADTHGRPHRASPARAQRGHGIDPSVPLADRVRPAPASLLEQFDERPGPPAPDGTPDRRPLRKAVTHELSDAERRAFAAALADLTPLHRRIFAARLHAFYFVDAPEMAGTAMTMPPIDYEGPSVAFDIMFRGSIFRETVSGWLTSKERTCFDAAGSTMSVAVEAGALDAVRYALLHEATHGVDKVLQLTPDWDEKSPAGVADTSPFTRGVWTSPREIAPPYASPVLQAVTFNPGTFLSIARAPEVYAALARTPFVSLYASRSWSEDVAELVAVSHWTTALGQPFRFVVRDGTREVQVYEPMTSPPVRQRLGAIERFYSER